MEYGDRRVDMGQTGGQGQRGWSMVIEEYGFVDLLSVEAMVNDLRRWGQAGWAEMQATK